MAARARLQRAAAYGWQHDLTKHFAGVGRGLGRAVAEYNRTVEALETRVLSAAERLRRLGGGSDRAPQAVSPITTMPRPLEDGAVSTQGGK